MAGSKEVGEDAVSSSTMKDSEHDNTSTHEGEGGSERWWKNSHKES